MLKQYDSTKNGWGQFTPKTWGQFAPEYWGQFHAENRGLFGRNFQDGRTKAGIEVSAGIYYYIVTLPDGERKKGFIELIR